MNYAIGLPKRYKKMRELFSNEHEKSSCRQNALVMRLCLLLFLLIVLTSSAQASCLDLTYSISSPTNDYTIAVCSPNPSYFKATISNTNSPGDDCTASGLKAIVAIPAGFKYSTGSTTIQSSSGGSTVFTSDPTINGQNLTWDLGTTPGNLGPSSSAAITFGVTSDCGADPASGQPINLAIEYTMGVPKTLPQVSTPQTILVKRGQLNIEKVPITTPNSGSVITAAVGDYVEWNLVVKNAAAGEAAGPLYNIRLSDQFDSGLEFVSITAPAGDTSTIITPGNPATVAIPGPINPGETWTGVIKAKVVGCSNLVETVTASWGCNPEAACTDSVFTFSTKGSIKIVLKVPSIDIDPVYTSAGSYSIPYCSDQTVTLHYANAGAGWARGVHVHMGNLPSQFQVSSLPGCTISPDPDHPTDLSKFILTIGDVAGGATGDAQFKLMMKSDWSACDAAGGILTMEPDYTDDCGNPWAPPLGLIYFSVDSSKKPTLTLTKTPTSTGSNILKPNDANTEASFDLQVKFNSNGGGCTSSLPVDIVDTYPEGFAVVESAGGVVDSSARTITWPSTDAAQTLSDGAIWKKTIKLGPQSSACDMCTGTYSTLLSARPPAGVDCCGCTLSGSASADIIVNGPTLTVSKTASGLANDYLILRDVSQTATFDLTADYEKNDGCSDTLDAKIVDTYPAGFTVVDAAGGLVDTTAHTITWPQTGGDALASGSLWTKTVKIQPPAGSCGESFVNTLTATEVNSGAVCPLLSDSKSVKIMVNCVGGTGSVFTTEKTSTAVDACSDIAYTTTYTFQSAVTDWTGYKFGVHFTGPQEFPSGGAPATFAVYDADDSQVGSTKSNYLSPETVSGVPELEMGSAGLDLPLLPQNGKLVVTYTLHTTGPGEIIDWSDLMVSGGQTYHQGLPVKIEPSGPPSFKVKLNIPSVIETCGEFDASIEVTQEDDYYAYGLMSVTLDTANYEYVAGSASISGFEGTGPAAEPDLSTGKPIWNLGDKVRTTSGKGTISFKIKKACGTGPAARALLDYRDKCGGTYQKVGSDEKPVLVGTARLILTLTPETIYATEDAQTWRIYVTNTGTGAAYNSIVTDTLGTNLQYVAGSAKVNDAASEPLDSSSSTLQWKFDSIDIKKTNIIEFQTKLTGCSPGPNTAVAQWGCDYNNPCSTTSTSTSRVVLNTNYQFAVQLGTAPVDPCGDRSGPFSLTITNSGGVHAYGVTATQSLPIGLGIVDGIADGVTYAGSHQPLLGFDSDTGQLSLDFAGQDWAPGEYCQISYYLQSDTTPPCKFDPTAASTSASVDYHTPCGSSKAEASNQITLSSANSQLELTKVQIHPSSSIVDKDTEVSWKITVKNPSGNLWTARNVVVKDLLPANTQFVAVPVTPGYEATTAPYTGDGTSGNELTWNLGDMAVGSERNIIVNAIVTACDAGKNTATITWGCCGDTKHTSASTPINVNLKTKPSFSITQTSNVNVCSGTISLTISNTGATAKGPFTLTDTIPEGFVYNGVSSAKINGNSVTMPTPTSTGTSPVTLLWDLTGLFAEDKMLKDDALSVTFNILDDGSHCGSPAANPQNAATFSGNDLCSNTVTRTASSPVTILAPNLIVTKTPHDQKAVVGQKNSWTLTVTNTGTSDAENVVVTDAFGSAYQIADPASDVPGGTIQSGGAGSMVTWNLLTLAGNGGSWTKVVSATLTTTSSDMNNVVHAEGKCSSGCVYGSADDTAAATYVTVTKSATASTLTIGDKVDFIITASLLGAGVPFTNVKIKDTLPKGLDVVGSDYYSCSDPASCSGITVTREPSGEDQLITWSLPNFVGAKTVQITLHAVVKDKVNGVSYNKDGNTLVNKVDLVRTVYGQTSTDSDEVSMSLVEPKLKLEKAVDNTANNPITHNPMYHPGDAVTYTISLYHDTSSHAVAYQVDVQDTLPTGMAYVPGSIKIINGPAGTADDTSAGAKLLKWHFDQIEQSWVSGNPILLSYQAKIDDDVQTGILNNKVIADYYTKLSPIDNPERRMEPELAASKTINAAVACIGDKVWEDSNGNGMQDSGEPGIAGVTVTLFKSDGTQVGTPFTTLADGAYSFSHLEPGDYYLRLSPPPSSSYVFTPKGIGAADTDSNAENAAVATYGQTDKRTLSIGETISCDNTVDAGLYIPTCINGLAWVDTNGNGIKDGSESLLKDVSVTLYRKDDFGGADLQKAVTTTDSSGAYSFSNLQPGTYYVVFAKPTGTNYLFIIKSTGSETQVLDSSGKTSTVTLTSGQPCDGTLKAGLYLPASLGDFVWHDRNANGIQDTEEIGIKSARITLHRPDGSTITATTDANGKYLFSNLVPGSYYLVFTKPSGYSSFSPKDQGSDDSVDSDADVSTYRTTTITLVSGQNDLTWDAGVYKYASLGDFVWHDKNANGIQDTGETGIKSVTVTLHKPDGTTRTTTTDANGKYLFSSLVPGSYYVAFAKPTGYDCFSPKDQGSDDSVDSDADISTYQTTTITLVSGQNDLTWDAGVYKYASLGDFVWHDKNANGIQDAGEEGIAGVTVTLYKSGLAVDTTTTDSEGKYQFTGLVPASYSVGFTKPAEYDSFSPRDQGSDNAVDSEADVADGKTASTTLQSGDSDSTWDAGLYKFTCLNGLAWVDTNGNGIKDGSESLLKDVSVALYRKDDFDGADVQKAVTTTDSSGAYSFSDIQPGTYYVVFTKSSGTDYLFIFESTGSDTKVTNSNGQTSTVTLKSGDSCDGTLKAGLYLPASLGDFVWHDLNANGIQETGEEGIADVTVALYKSGVAIGTTKTGLDGSYKFTGLVPGVYSVKFDKPAGYDSFSPKDQGGEEAKDSDADATGQTADITLVSGQNDPTWDAGVYKYASLGDFVWHDRNANGIQETGEEGIADVTVALFKSGVASGTTKTGLDGSYKFTGLVPGVYSVKFDKPAGYDSFSPKDQGGEEAKDSDADATGQTADITLVSGQEDLTLDAGVFKYASLGDFVWHDRNANGIQETGEEGIADVTVTLYKSGLAVNTTTTDSDGKYQFTGLVPASYYVVFTKPAEYDSFSPRDQGGDEGKDSDADAADGKTASIQLQSGDSDSTWDAGLCKDACLGGLAWVDTNGNGIKDSGESGLQGVSVTLFRKDDFGGADVQKAVMSTGPSGAYSFSDLQPGTYYVVFTKPTGTDYLFVFESTGGETKVQDASGKSSTVVLTSGQPCDGTLKAGLYLPASLGDLVWHDRNANGIQEAGEEGIAGVTVTLYKSGAFVGTTNTLADGIYQFNNLAPGSYSVKFDKPAGYDSFSPMNLGGDNEKDSNADAASGQIASATLQSGSVDNSWDAGLYSYTCLNGLAWVDTNGNGIKDGSESLLKDVSVTLYRKDDFGGADVQKAVASTDSRGAYSFIDLQPGTYYVIFAKPSGTNYLFIIKSAGSETQVLDSSGQTSTVALTSGQQCDGTLKAGLYLPASLGDFVWHDRNANGIQETGEEGIADVAVTLYKSGEAISTTTTLADGKYQFTDLAPGSYYVVFTKPAGYDSFSPKDQGGDNAFDSNADSVGQTDVISLASEETNLDIDAGLNRKASLSDFFWEDLNANGIQDPGETGIPSATVLLFDASGNKLAETTTDADGFYKFTDLNPGDYFVQFVPPTGFSWSPKGMGDAAQNSDAGLDGKTDITSLISGENNLDLDAGAFRMASIGDYVWTDENANGIQDQGEPGLATVKVELYSASGTKIAETFTNADGWYQFTGLRPGDYYLVFSAPEGHYQSPADQGGNDALDSDTGIDGKTAITSLASGENDITWDAGYYRLSALGGFVWEDLNADGIYQPGEGLAIPGVTVNLYHSDGTLAGTTTTDANGQYLFTDLMPGDYYLIFQTPQGYSFSPANQGGDDGKDSDPSISGMTETTTLLSGETDLTWWAGLNRKSSLGDYVWNDANANGLQDPGEAGIPDVSVQLYDAFGNMVQTTTTDANGRYGFTDLQPGSYTLKFLAPAGLKFSPKDAGDNLLDSDANDEGLTGTIVLVSGQNDPSWDAGLYGLASLGDTVWLDINGNGLQDENEPGVAGVVVNLYSSDDKLIKTTSTDANGRYEFKELDVGTYYLIFSSPQGYDFTALGQGSDPAKDSNADSSGRTASVILTTGMNDPTIDAGLTMPASLGDFVWYDSNADGIFQSGEAGIPNVLVELYRSDGTLAASTTTDGSGHYAFVQLAPGDYYLLFHAPDGYHFSQMDQGSDDSLDSDAYSNGRTDVFSLPSGANDMSWDAGLNDKTALGDFVWVDYNKDGIQDDGEPGIVDIKVTLYSQDGNEIGSTTTDENGRYLFSVSPGQYYLIFGLPEGFAFTKQNQGIDTEKDSNPDSSGKTAVFQINSGQADLSLDAGLYTKQDPIITAALGDFVWVDYNKNGIQDDGEPGIADVKVTLYSLDGKEVDSTTTDENGRFIFRVSPGQYYLIFGLPEGFAFTGQNQGSDTEKDSNPDSSGKTAVFQINSGQTDLSLDAGVYTKQYPIIKHPILNLTKTCLTKSVASGGEAVFRITYSNAGDIVLNNVTLTEFYPKGSIFLYASVAPDSSNNSVWTIGTLKPGDSGYIDVTLLMPERANLTFNMQQSVKGEGFVRVHNDMDTRPQPISLTNQARISSSETGPISTSSTITLDDKPGTVISVRESGSGKYQTELISRLITENRTTESITSLSATHRPTSFKLPDNRTIVYKDRWTEDIRGKNEISKASVRESYRYATSIDRNQSLKMSENGSTMKTDVKFDGAGHIGVLKKQSDDVKPFEKPVFESREDYTGRFNISEYADEYGDNVMTNRSVQGNGTVSTAKTVRASQGTYEYGTGDYDVQEQVVSGSSYMAKDIKLAYEPYSFNYTPRLAVNQSMKWNEGMFTKSGNAELRGGGLTNKSCIADVDSTLRSYIGQEFTSLNSLNKTTEIKGLSEMNTEAQFKGQARFRTLLESGKDGSGTKLADKSRGSESNPERIDMDEQYAGEFKIIRKTALTGVSRYDMPHISVWKDGHLTYGLVKTVNATIAEYTITMINDGSRSLGPIEVRDTFPAKTQFIDSSLRPTEQTAQYANWTIVSLGIGSTNTIRLRLNVTEEAGDLVNVVEATGWHSSGLAVGRNISALERAGLPCCQPQILAEKTAALDPADPTLIHYKISIKNTASSPMAVQVVDYMPPDLSIITSSLAPSDYRVDQTTWTLTAVQPGEVKTITYSARAKRNGAYTNQAHLQAYSLDGSGSASAVVSASVVVGGSDQPAKTQRYGGDWQPPADEFGLTTTDEGIGTLENI